MNTMFKKFATGTAALALMTTVFASTTMAADNVPVTKSSTSEAVITGADSVTMGEVVVGSFPATILNGKTQVIASNIAPFTITDARGTGAGWNVMISATQFSQPEGTHKLAEGALNLTTAPTIDLADPNSDVTGTITKGTGLIDNDVTTPVKLLSAVTDGGMGSYSVKEIPMELTLKPHEVYEGTYSSTVTVTLTTGP